jgi:hypothetical protein
MIVALQLAAAAAQSPYGNNPGVASPVPAPAQPNVPRILGGAPAPPVVAPGAAAPPNLVQRPVGPPVEIPGARPGDSFGDRVSRCIHYGSAQGVPPGQIGQFSAECAN